MHPRVPHTERAHCPCTAPGVGTGAEHPAPRVRTPTAVPRLRGMKASARDRGTASIPPPQAQPERGLTQHHGSPQHQQPAQPLHPAHPSPRCCPAPTGALNTTPGWAGSCQQPTGKAPSIAGLGLDQGGGVALCCPPAPPWAPMGAFRTPSRVGADAVCLWGLGWGSRVGPRPLRALVPHGRAIPWREGG